MSAKVDICNMAIGRLGISQFIGDIDAERSNEANTCRIFYDNARDRALQAMPWNFAKRFSDLQDIGNPPPGWGYRFRYPNDCLKARQVIPADLAGSTNQFLYPGDITILTGTDVPFEVIEDEASGGLAIVTNLSPVTLVYTARILNTTLYSQGFIDCLAWTLATDLAAPLSAAPNMAQAAGQAYKNCLLEAGAINLNERKNDEPPVSEFISSRS